MVYAPSLEIFARHFNSTACSSLRLDSFARHFGSRLSLDNSTRQLRSSLQLDTSRRLPRPSYSSSYSITCRVVSTVQSANSFFKVARMATENLFLEDFPHREVPGFPDTFCTLQNRNLFVPEKFIFLQGRSAASRSAWLKTLEPALLLL